MRTSPTRLAAAVAVAGCLGPLAALAQTPDQTQLWDQQRASQLADQKAREELLARERAARRADPMLWVRSLDPMTAGGWEFRSVAGDGSWAAFVTHHQLKRSGNLITVWLRQEYPEPQTGGGGRYSSAVEKIQYDCAKDRSRTLLVVYYAANNLQGSEQSEESDPKTAAWNSVVPGTRDETNFLWACNTGRAP